MPIPFLPNWHLHNNHPTFYDGDSGTMLELASKLHGKMNEIIENYNKFIEETNATVEGATAYLRDNLHNSIKELLDNYGEDQIMDIIYSTYSEELSKLNVFVTPQMFGAVADGHTDDTGAIISAINSLPNGGVVYFPDGEYVMSGGLVPINYDNITLTGPGSIIANFGFRINASHFKAEGLKMYSLEYSQDSRGFRYVTEATQEATKYIKDIVIKNCYFQGFFYAVSMIGGSYNYDGTEAAYGFPVRDLVIENCHSVVPDGYNAGHFQCIQVENISYINNRTYGGENASSYNAIKGNGYIRVIGNYDHSNAYASCEIENGCEKAIIANNTFNSKIWIDDSFDVVVNGNTTEEGILISVGSNVGNAENIVVSNNVCKNIRCEQYGSYLGGLVNHLHITGNTVKGTNTHGIWVHGNAAKAVKISNNFISGVNTNDIAIQRNDQLVCYITGNVGNDKIMLIAGTGGLVYAADNYNMSVSGNRDSLPVSHLEREFNGLKITDSAGDAWRLNVSTTGEITVIKY